MSDELTTQDTHHTLPSLSKERNVIATNSTTHPTKRKILNRSVSITLVLNSEQKIIGETHHSDPILSHTTVTLYSL